MYNDYARMKYISSIIILGCFCFDISLTAFPLERDVRESVGVPQPKRWIVFMERRASKCLEDIRAKFATSLMHALRCMFERGMFDRCVIFGRRHCLLIHRYPNIIKIVGEYLPWMVSIRILIHRQFNLNVTMVQSNIPPFVDFTRLWQYVWYFEIAERKFSGPHQPVTIITLDNTITIKFIKLRLYSAVIEYDVVQNLNMKSGPQMRENAMYFSLGDFLVTCFQIKVDVRARLSLGIITCMVCHILVYDGPNERLPIIMKMNNTNQAKRVIGSTFQVYVVMIGMIISRKAT